MTFPTIVPMQRETVASVILPVYNEAATIQQALVHLYQQIDIANHIPLARNSYEIIIVNNNSTDNTLELVAAFQQSHPDLPIVVTTESRQGVAWARKTGIELAIRRSHERDARYHCQNRDFYLFSADADCHVEPLWFDNLINAMRAHKALAVCQYTYPEQHFHDRPVLWKVIQLLLKARDYAMRLFGGFPDGKGFALPRAIYEKVNGIDIFYQVLNGEFICHLSDDWDFGIKTRALGEEIIYVPNSVVMTNPRRIDHALDEMINGIAYGKNGIIGMRDIRPDNDTGLNDISESEALLLYEYSIKDFTTKHIILPLLLTPAMLERAAIRDFLSTHLCESLGYRISQIVEQMRIRDFSPIHLYKTPCYRLYFEFREKIFARMRSHIDPEIGLPPLPKCLSHIQAHHPNEFNDFVYYYCEDRESGEAHNYFGNGGVF